MIRKALSLAALTVVVSALFGTASAMALELHSEFAPAKIVGEQVEQLVLTVNSGTIKCSTAKFEGENSTIPTRETLFTSAYSGCTAFGSSESTNCTNCKYRTTWFGLETDWEAETHDSEALGCTVSLPKQHLKGISFENTGVGTERRIVETVKASGISYTETGLLCVSPGSHTNGTLVGRIRYSGLGQGIWLE